MFDHEELSRVFRERIDFKAEWENSTPELISEERQRSFYGVILWQQ